MKTALIYPRFGARRVSPARVAELAVSLRAIGLRTAITVKAAKRHVAGQLEDAFEIVAGQHRFEAAVSLGWTEIDAVVMEGDAEDAELWEIEENLNREELTPAQAAIAHKRREEILVAKGLVSRQGRPEKGAKSAQLKSYANQSADALGVSTRTVQLDLARGKKVDPEILSEIEGTALDKGVVLDRLAAVPADRQRETLDDIRREAKPRSVVRLADEPLNDIEACERQLAALMGAWNKAGPDARRKFLERVDTPVFERGDK